LNTAQVSALATTQVRSLTTEQIVAIETTDLKAMTTAQVAAFNTAQVASFGTDQIAVLTTAQVVAFTTTNIAALTSTEVAAFETTAIRALTTAQVAALNTEAVSVLDTADIASMTTASVRAFTTVQIAALNTDAVAALTTAQIHELTTTQMQAFTTDQIVALETTDLAALSMTQSVAFTSTQIGAMSAAQVDALISASPIVLDLNGDGVRTTSAGQGNSFDLNATGSAAKHGWTSSGDGLLVMDRNHDGTINNGTELFGTGTVLANGQRAGDGYSALRELDSDHDGKITAADANFKELQVWVDGNGDGITDGGELKTLASLGIIELDLGAKTGTEIDNGNLLGLVSGYKTSDGATHDMADVWFSKEVANSTLTAASFTGDDANQHTTVQVAAAAGASNAQSEDGKPANPLGVTAHDLLSDRGEDLLAGQADPNTSNTTLEVASVTHHDLPLVQVDHTQLVDDKQNNLLI
jgi:ALTTAQ repeat-containing protein